MLTKAEAAGMMRAVQEYLREKIDAVFQSVDARLTAVESRQPQKGDAGPQGIPGKDGDTGPQGERGLNGADGRDGLDGQPGRDGVDGAPGEKGLDGLNGADGRDGVDGKDGMPGVAGEKGDRGEQGPTGKLPIAKVWSDHVHYQGDVVTANGCTWQALCDTGKSPGHDDWICLVERGADGRDGKDGRGVTVRGTFATELEYRELDVVAMNGASFMARRDNPGDCPGDGWQLVASQGKRGSPGERGPKGDRGERGDPGSAVVAMQCDPDGMLTLINGDGSTVQCDLYPILSKFKVQ